MLTTVSAARRRAPRLDFRDGDEDERRSTIPERALTAFHMSVPRAVTTARQESGERGANSSFRTAYNLYLPDFRKTLKLHQPKII